MKLRRAYSLISFWEHDKFIVENYLTTDQVYCNPFLLQIIDAAGDFIDDTILISKFSLIPDVKQIINSLFNQNVLLKKGSAIEKKDSLLNNQWKWKHDARFFHFATKKVNYTFDYEKIRRSLEKKALNDPPPSPFKTEINNNKTILARLDLELNGFWRVLFSRRTCRELIDKPISKKVFANFIFSIAGMTQFYNSSTLDKRIIKTSPSGGARHPIEVYTIIRNIKGIDPGVYHYEVETNALSLVGPHPGTKILNKLFSGQNWVQSAAVCFIFTAILTRSMWKYDHSRAYRVVLLDAGHLGQTFHLAATALNLGVFTTAAIQDKLIEKYLKIDGITEIVLYGGAIGYSIRNNKKNI